MAQKFPPSPLFSQVQPIEDGYLLLSAKGVMEDFAQDLSPAAWHSKPTWFVIACNDRAIAPEQEESTAKRMDAKTLTLASSHLPMLSQPDRVAAFVIEAAASISANTAAAKQSA
jgi:pimeloyl-ACP methyl ester carboxylesterase